MPRQEVVISSDKTIQQGRLTFGFAYTTSGHADGYNHWTRRTVETLPDGGEHVVYTNFLGQVLVKELRHGADRWIEHRRYDDAGREILHAEPSAVLGYDDTQADLGVALRASDGLIHVTEYHATTGGGAAAGYRKADKLRRGSGGADVPLREYEYVAQAAGTQTVYRVSKETVSRNEDGTGAIVTSYAYTLHAGTLQVQERTTTLPAVPTSQNGSGVAATRVERYDRFGNLLWSRDERGVLTKQEVDPVLGVVAQRIDDVDTAQTSDEPPGWTTVSGFGLHLVSDFAYDARGRLVRTLGPVHEAIVNGQSRSVRTATWNIHLDAAHETRTALGYLDVAAGASAIVNPVSIVKRNERGNVLEEIRAVRATTAGEPTAADTFARTDYVAWTVYEYTDCCRLLAVLVYHDIPAAGEGLPWTNYACTTYGYDAVRRRNKTVTPGGTITRVVFDARGNVVQTWIGTNDNGATDADPTGDGASGNTMVLVSEREYDGGLPGYDGLLTEQVLYPSDTEFRQTFSAYDWRHRLVDTTGEEGFFEKRSYDNLGRVTKTERYDGSASGTLLARSETFYDDRGRVYRTVQHEVDPGTGAIGNALTDDIWFDAAGNVIKSLPSGAKLFTKSVYDGLGRATKRFDGYDLDETEYGDAVSVVDDTILWQIETAYDPEGKAISSASRHRYHEATGTGELSGPSGAQPKARINYAAAWFDPTGRRVAIARYGSNGGSALVRPASVATRTDTCLVSETFYDPAGRPYRTVDPSGREDRTEYDARGRRVTRIENYKDGAVSPVFPDEDRTTRWTYAPDGGVETLTAVNPDTGDQTTTYVYGTTRGDSGVARSDLKRAEIYPDSDDAASPLGNGPDGVYDRIEFRYDRLGAVIEVKDQNGTVHAYDYDGLGRVVQDRVTTVGTGIDGAVRRIETAYDSRGLRSRVTSYDNATVNSGTALNEVVAEYNGFVQLVREYQAVDGAVNMFTTPKVEYAYADGSTNTVRPIGLTYPSSRTINYGYGTVGSADDAASRVASITDSDPSSTQLVGYIYLGAGIVVEVDYPEPDLKYTLIGTAGGTDPNTGDVYLGLDRFGRIKDACWRDYGAGTVAVRLKYGYDRSGNRLWREDSVAVDHGKNFDELYAYDGLSRLTDMRRGRLNVDKMVLTTTTFVQDWNLDATGNWSRFREDADGDAVWDLVQNRTGSRANEIASISETAGPAWADPAYDQAGNMTTLPKPASPTATFTAVYDAWNRLVRLRDSATNQIVQENVYDGRQFQVVQKTYSSGTLAETRQFYHTADWQVIEERIGTAASAERQFVWGLRYIDELVLRDRNTGAHNSPDERLYALQDANWNVVALLDVSGSVLERYSYAPYGRSVALAGDYTTGTSAHDGRFLFASYRWEDSGIAVVRNRALAANVGWLQRDPLGTLVGRNLYEYVDGNPIRATDPMGTEAEVNTAADADGGCTAQEEKCIEDARQAAIRAINMNSDMFGRVVCPTGRSSCDSPELADCIRSGLENGNFACADRGTGGCHKGEKNSGHTDTPCGKLKSDSAKGTVDGKPDACEPCKHPQEVANNCAACADDVMKQSKTILCRDAPRGGICRNSNLAALLVHEAAHNCVGGHDTTNPDKQPKQQPTATCDKCGRPDAGGIEGGFKPMR